MIFFIQVAGNSMQIFASEVFPTNARASGFGWAAGVGRLATAFIVPTILWVQTGYGLTTVFVCLAVRACDRRGRRSPSSAPRPSRRASTRSPRRPAERRQVCIDMAAPEFGAANFFGPAIPTIHRRHSPDTCVG